MSNKYLPRLLTGPKPIPFAGNVHQLPKTDFFKIYSSWAKIYGQILKFWRLDKEVVLTTRPFHIVLSHTRRSDRLLLCLWAQLRRAQ